MSDDTSKSTGDLRSALKLACPECGYAETLSIEIRCTAILSAHDIEAHDDYEWDNTSCCFCDECGHNGVVGEFRVADAAVTVPDAEVHS